MTLVGLALDLVRILMKKCLEIKRNFVTLPDALLMLRDKYSIAFSGSKSREVLIQYSAVAVEKMLNALARCSYQDFVSATPL